MASADPQSGVRQVAQNLAVEGLVRDWRGRPPDALARARAGTFTPDGRTLTMQSEARREVPRRLRRDARRSSPMLLETMLPALHGAGVRRRRSDRGVRTTPRSTSSCDSARRSCSKRSKLQFRKPGPAKVGTGPFEPAGPESPTELRGQRPLLPRPAGHRPASSVQYLSERRARPGPRCCATASTCCTKSGADALDSLERSNQISVFTYIRHYQYVARLQHPAASAPIAGGPTGAERSRSIATRSSARRSNGHGVRLVGPGLAAPLGGSSRPADKFAFDTGAAAPRKVLGQGRRCTSPVWSRPIVRAARAGREATARSGRRRHGRRRSAARSHLSTR